MRRVPEQIEAELLAEAEVMIEELLTWGRQAGRPNLTEMEDQVLVLRQSSHAAQVRVMTKFCGQLPGVTTSR